MNLEAARAALTLFPGEDAGAFVSGLFALDAETLARASCVLFHAGDPVLTDGGAFPRCDAVAALGPGAYHSVGHLDGVPLVAAEIDDKTVLPAGLASPNLRGLAMRAPGAVWAAAAYASQVLHWARTNRFCGLCAAPMVQRKPLERAMVCTACGHSVWPRLAPCTIALVYDRAGRVLMTRKAEWPAGRYGLVAGFLEPGETLEACVRREVYEETGVRVGRVDYAASQPWPFPHQLMVGYFAEAESNAVSLLDGELEDARWFAHDALPQLPPRLSIARSLVDAWRVTLAPTDR